MSTDLPEAALFNRADHGTQPHQLVILTANGTTWLEQLALRYRQLRSETRVEPVGLTLDGVEILSVRKLKNRLAASQIADRSGGNFDIIRSDLGEIILNYVGQELDGFQYGYQSIRDRELKNLAGRSIDQIGVKTTQGPDGQTNLALMLGEAKVSTEPKSPPSVVDTKKDSLSKSHTKQLAEVESTADKIWHAYKFCVDQETQMLFGLAVEMFESAHPQLTVYASSVLVRPNSIASINDFGSYLDNPDQFNGAVVNFYIVRANSDDLEGLVDTFFELATTEPSKDAT